MHGGGSGANIAAWLAADGAEVAFVGRRGADIAGRNRDMELMGYGVDARLVMDPERPTGTCVVMVTHKGDHTMMSDPGANAALHPDDLPKDLFAPGAHLHMSGYTLLNEGSRPAALAAFGDAGRAGMTISVDGASSAPLERVGAEPFLEMTNGATLLFVNADAGRRAHRPAKTPSAAARVLTAWYPAGRGEARAPTARCSTRTAAPTRSACPRPPVETFVDGTGAGRRLLRRLPARLAGQEAAAARRWAAAAAWPRTRSDLVGARPLSESSQRAAFLDGLFSLDGRVALVTGGSSGIGHAMARALALAGARVVLLARGKDGLAGAVAAIQSAGGAGRLGPGRSRRSGRGPARGRGDRGARTASRTSWSTRPASTSRPPLGELTLEQWAA